MNKISRKSKGEKPKDAYLVVVEGQTERIYIEKLKEQERSLLKGSAITIEPKIESKGSIQRRKEQILKDRKEKHYAKIYWILDGDELSRSDKVKGQFKRILNELNRYKDIIVLVNMPCIEYWFLLHLKSTTALYNQCKQVEEELKRTGKKREQKFLSNYDKKQRILEKVYEELKPFQKDAIERAEALKCTKSIEHPCAGIYLFLKELGL